MTEERSEIAFFDLETTFPSNRSPYRAILEFAAILVCPKKLTVLDSYSTLICPNDLSLLYPPFERRNGINTAEVSSAPPFSLLADKIFDILNGRIWAGHNILSFDCPLIRKAFEEIGRAPPAPKGIIDSLTLLNKRFGRRAGDMKMDTLATYFGLGEQTHRSLDDVHLNLEVLKCCATVLFLESSLADTLSSDRWVSPNSVAWRTRDGGRVSPMELGCIPTSDTRPINNSNQSQGLQILLDSSKPETESIGMTSLSDKIMHDAIQVDDALEERPLEFPCQWMYEGSRSLSGFLTPDNVCIPLIRAYMVPFSSGNRRMQILHDSVALKLHCTHLKVRFGIRTRFVYQAGHPKLSFVVDAPPSLCQILEACDSYAQILYTEYGSTSVWIPVVSRKYGYYNFPGIRLHIPTVVSGEVAKYGTDIFQKEAASTSSAEQKLVFSIFDAVELESLFTTGTLVDAFFSLVPYDYQQNAGIRLVCEKLVIHSK